MRSILLLAVCLLGLAASTVEAGPWHNRRANVQVSGCANGQCNKAAAPAKAVVVVEAPATAAKEVTINGDVTIILGRLNALRARLKLPLLVLCPRLCENAQSKANINLNQFQGVASVTHHPLNGEVENVGANFSPDGACNVWEGSGGHYRNMTGGYTRVGIGVARAANGMAYYVQQFE